jgi:lipid-A-disaccharide synthase
VWAWKSSRVKLIKKCVDRMLVLFPFEEEFYAKHGFKADFVGHPLLDEVRADRRPGDLLNTLGFNEKRPTLALLPGSREKEISRHLPVMLKAATLLQKKHPELQVVLLQAKNIKDNLFRMYLKGGSPNIKVTMDYYNGLNCADFCVVASGTATLEAAILGKPMAVIYRTSWPTWLIAKFVIRIPNIALVNIVAGKKIVEELIQTSANPQKIAKVISTFLTKPDKVRETRKELAGIRARLGMPGASQRAAKIVLAELSSQSNP